MDSAAVIIQLSTSIDASDCHQRATFTYYIYIDQNEAKGGICAHKERHTGFVLRFKLVILKQAAGVVCSTKCFRASLILL